MPHLSDEDTDDVARDVCSYYLAKVAKNYKFVNEAQPMSPIDRIDSDPSEARDIHEMTLSQAPSEVHLCDFEKAILVPPHKRGYSLMFGTLDFFVLVRRIIMIYERFIIAKRQISEKVTEDINNPKIIEQLLKEIGNGYSLEKLVASLQGQQNEMVEERFNIFVGSVMSTLNKTSEEKKSKYEDISRVLMGSRAYLLFEF